MSLRKIVTLWSFAAAFLILLLVGSFQILQKQERAVFQLYDEAQALTLLSKDLLQALTDRETGQRGYLLTRDPAFLEPYRVAGDAIDSLLKELKPRIGADDFAALERQIASRAAYFKQTLQPISSETDGENAQAMYAQAVALVRTGQGKAYMDSMRYLIATVIEHSKSQTLAKGSEYEEKEKLLLAFDWFAALLLLSGLAISNSKLGKSVIEPLEEVESNLDRLANNKPLKFSPVERGTKEVLAVRKALESASIKLASFYAENSRIQAELEFKNTELKRRAYTDNLTGLLNPAGLLSWLEDRETFDQDVAIILINIDFLKSVNDNYSSRGGDEYLSGLARLLSNRIGNSGQVARLSNEDFGIVLPWSSALEISSAAELIKSSIEVYELVYQGYSIKRTATLAIARSEVLEEFHVALQRASAAIISAKSTGPNQIAVALKSDKTNSVRRVFTSDEIAAGIRAGEFVYYLQPVVDSAEKKVVGFEALIRWQQSDETVLPPSDFLPYFVQEFFKPEHSESRRMMHDAVLNGLKGFEGAYIAWNFNLEQFASDSFVNALIERQEPPFLNEQHPVVLEINEKSLTPRTDIASLKHNLQRLRDGGYQIALDDFGTEQSNFTRMMTLPLDVIKLDKSLVDFVENNPSARAAVRFLCLMAKDLSLKVIAEGTETSFQVRLLIAAGAPYHQGYFYTKPIPVEEIVRIGPDLIEPLIVAESKLPPCRHVGIR